MLRGIHKASANWLGRALMGLVLGLIAISFGIWGIGDIFRGFGQSTLAKVGRTEIGIEQFRQLYSDRLQEIGRRLGRPVTPDQARLLGLDRQILGQLIAETALDERTRELGLGIPQEEVARIITEDPAFRGVSGQFDHNRFVQIIRQAGFTEARFIAEQRSLLLRQQLATALTGEMTPPKTLAEAVHRFQTEQRTIDYVVLNRSQAGDIPAPTPEVLNNYYEQRKVLFRAPEYRKISMLVLTPDDLAATMEVSDADIKRAYEDHKARYVVPERRHVQQILFPKPEEARAAADRLANGLKFDALAAEPSVKDRFTDLGTVTKSGMIDPTFANAAFTLKEGETSAPIEGRFGTALLHVVKITPGKEQPLEQVAAAIKRELALDRARREVQATRDKIEDERLDGKTLAQTAEKLKLKLRTIDAVDRSGRGPDGKPVTGLPAGVDILASAFASDVGADNDALPIQGGGSVWYDVLAVTSSRDRPLEEVKQQVETRWRDDEIAAKLTAKTNQMLEKLKSGSTLADIANADKLKVQTAKDLKRGNAMSGFSLRALNAVFHTAKDAYGVTEGDTATDRIVFRVTGVTVTPYQPDTPEAKKLAESLQRTLADDLFAQYLIRLQSDIGVTINESALNQITGATTN